MFYWTVLVHELMRLDLWLCQLRPREQKSPAWGHTANSWQNYNLSSTRIYTKKLPLAWHWVQVWSDAQLTMCPPIHPASWQGSCIGMGVRDLGVPREVTSMFNPGSVTQESHISLSEAPPPSSSCRRPPGKLRGPELIGISCCDWEAESGPAMPTESTTRRESGLKAASEKPLKPILSFCFCGKWGPEGVNTLPKFTQQVKWGLGHIVESQSRSIEARPAPQTRGMVVWVSTQAGPRPC